MMKRKFNVELLVKVTVGVLMFLLTTFLFYAQAVKLHGAYGSDLPSHIYFAENGIGYSILYYMMGFLLKADSSYVLVAMFESMLVVLAWFLGQKFIKKYFDLNQMWTLLVSTGLLFLADIYVPYISNYIYRGGILTQSWHNITYIAMRVFALLTMYEFLEVWENYLKNITVKDWLKIAIPLFLATLIKPNFLVAFAFTLLTALIVDFFTCRLDVDKFKRIVIMGTTVFPAVFVIWWQSSILYGSGTGEDASGIAVVFLSSVFWKRGLLFNVIRLLKSLAFPTIVWWYNRKVINRKISFVYLLYIITLIEVIILTETGPRAAHCNFWWGIYFSAYMLFLYAVSVFVCNLLENCKLKKDRGYNVAGVILLLAHLASGVYYFVEVLMGNSYYI